MKKILYLRMWYLRLYLIYLAVIKGEKLYTGKEPTIKYNTKGIIFVLSIPDIDNQKLETLTRNYFDDFLLWLRNFGADKIAEWEMLKKHIEDIQIQLNENVVIYNQIMNAVYNEHDAHQQIKLERDMQRLRNNNNKLQCKIKEISGRYYKLQNDIYIICNIVSGEYGLIKLSINNNKKNPCIYADYLKNSKTVQMRNVAAK